MIRTHLAGLPTGDRHIALGDPAEHLLNVLLRIPLLFLVQTEDLHCPPYTSVSTTTSLCSTWNL